jgi:predicted acetylornithine/succinylornithine family transaminase
MKDVQIDDEKYLLQNYRRLPVSFTRGLGTRLFDEKNREYLDCLCGIAVTSLGHCHPEVVATLCQQAEQLWHTSNLYYNHSQVDAAKLIGEELTGGKVFFCNSGTEANELVYKAFRSHANTNSKKKIITLKQSFHGRSFGSLSLTGQEKVHGIFGPPNSDVCYIAPNDLTELTEVFDKSVAGILIETVQGEGGVNPLSAEFIDKIVELCQQHGALLAVDEIQTGIARTGKMFAFQHYELEPDIVSMAKALGNGFPVGAVWIKDSATSLIPTGGHGSTYGGNFLATATVSKVFEIINRDNLCQQAKVMGKHLEGVLGKLTKDFPKLFISHRGLGLLQSLQLHSETAPRTFVEKALENQLVIGSAGLDRLRFAPALIFSKDDLELFDKKMRLTAIHFSS